MSKIGGGGVGGPAGVGGGGPNSGKGFEGLGHLGFH